MQRGNQTDIDSYDGKVQHGYFQECSLQTLLKELRRIQEVWKSILEKLQTDNATKQKPGPSDNLCSSAYTYQYL